MAKKKTNPFLDYVNSNSDSFNTASLEKALGASKSSGASSKTTSSSASNNFKKYLGLKVDKEEEKESYSDKTKKQIANYEKRIEATGKEKKKDTRNPIEKLFNVKEGQNAIFDFFEVLGRPQQALFGAIDSAIKGEDAWEGFKKGFGGVKETSGGQILRDLGMKDTTWSIPDFVPGVGGKSLGFGLDDVLGFGLDIFADPADVGLVSKVSKVDDLGKAAKAVDKVGDAARTADKVSDVAKSSYKFTPFAKGAMSTTDLAFKGVGKGVKGTAKLADLGIEKALGKIDANSVRKYQEAVAKYGTSAANKMYKGSDLLESYKYTKQQLKNVVDYTKALPGNILKKATTNKNAEQLSRIQIDDLINKTSDDVSNLAIARLGKGATKEEIAQETQKIFRDMTNYIEKDYKLEKSAKQILSDFTTKGNKFIADETQMKQLKNVLDKIPEAKGTYEIVGDTMKVNDKFFKNRKTILSDPKFTDSLSNFKISKGTSYSDEALSYLDNLGKDKDFVDLVEKHRGDFQKTSDIIRNNLGVDFSEITGREGYVYKAKGNLTPETEQFIMGKSSKNGAVASNTSRKYASGYEGQQSFELKRSHKKESLIKQNEGLEKQLSYNKKAALQEEATKINERMEKLSKKQKENLAKLDTKAQKIAEKSEALNNARNALKNKVTDDIIDKASKIQDAKLSNSLLKASNDVANTTKKYNELWNKLAKENLTEKELKQIEKQIVKYEDILAKQTSKLDIQIAKVKGAVDDTTLKQLDKALKATDKAEDIGSKLTKLEIKNKEIQELKDITKQSYADQLRGYEDRLQVIEAKFRGINDANDANILKQIEKNERELSLLESTEGQQMFDMQFNAGLREFMDNKLTTSTVARNYNDALLDGTLMDKNVIKFTEDLPKNAKGIRQAPKGWVEINGSDMYNKINNFKSILPENSDALMGFASSVKGKKVYMPKEASVLLDVAKNTQKDAGFLMKIINGTNNVFKKYKTLTPGFHVRNLSGNVTNMYLSGMEATAIPIYYGKAISTLNGADDIIKKAANGIENLSSKELKKYNTLKEFIDTGFYKSGTKLQDLEEVAESLSKKSSKFNIVSEASLAANEALDNASRLALFMYAKETPSYVSKLGKNNAIDAVKFALFDANNMTDIEKNVVKQIVPFYNFTKQNLLFQMSNITKNSKKYKRLGKAINGMYDSLGENDYFDFQKEAFQLPTPFKDSKGNTLFIKTNLPLSDLGEFASNPLQRTLSSTSSLIKAPIEQVTGKELFTGQDINKKSTIERLASYLGVDNLTTNMWKKVQAIQNSELSDNEKIAEIFRSILQNTNSEKVENSKLFEELQAYQNRVKELQNQGIDVPTIRDLTAQTKSNLNRFSKKRKGNPFLNYK